MAEMKDKETLRKAIAYFIDNSYDAVDYEALAALDRMAEREKRLESVIRWALGEKGTFPVRPEGAGLYWWRSELRLLSGLFPEDETGPVAQGLAGDTSEAVKECLTTEPPVVETAGAATPNPHRVKCWKCKMATRSDSDHCQYCGAWMMEIDPTTGETKEPAGAATPADWKDRCRNCGSNAWIGSECASCGVWESSRETSADNSSGGQIHVPQMSSPNQNEVTVEPNATERIAAALERIATALEGKC